MKKTIGWIFLGFRNLKSWLTKRKEILQKTKDDEPGLDKISYDLKVEQKMKCLKSNEMQQSTGRIKSAHLPFNILKDAEHALIMCIQRKHFSEEI